MPAEFIEAINNFMDQPDLVVADFGEVEERVVQLFTINFPDKLEASLTNYGGILTSLKVPDKMGKMDDVVLGYDSLEGYLKETPYFGAIAGRYANRIANGLFVLNGEKYTLAINSGTNHLHGGLRGFDKVIWQVVETVVEQTQIKITLRYTSHDGDEGYPGSLSTTVTYIFTANGFEVLYQAETDKPTVLNLTQHSYFNLSGNFRRTVLDHELSIKADTFLPVNKALIPTGEYASVEGSPFDFTSPKKVGEDIEAQNEQLKLGGGYDHCWVFDADRDVNNAVATLYHAESGRYMEVFTTEPGVQFYTGNFLENTIPAKDGVMYGKRSGLCLETQHFPDSPNQPHFPSVLLNVGEVFESRTVYRFSVSE